MWIRSRRVPATMSHEWDDGIRTCLLIKPKFYPAIDPVSHIPAYRLQTLASHFSETPHPAGRCLAELIHEGKTDERNVPVRLIRGVSASKGEAQFDLGRLPESMILAGGNTARRETFGPLDDEQMRRLWESIVSDSGAIDPDGRISLALQVWDNSYIIRNTGTSRRLALWCRLQNYVDLHNRSATRVRSLPARVDHLSLSEASLEHLQCKGRILFAHHSDALCRSIRRLEALEAGFHYVEPSRLARGYGNDDQLVMAMIAVPRADVIAPDRIAGLLDLHRWCDTLFDLGRYLTERSATYNLAP